MILILSWHHRPVLLNHHGYIPRSLTKYSSQGWSTSPALFLCVCVFMFITCIVFVIFILTTIIATIAIIIITIVTTNITVIITIDTTSTFIIIVTMTGVLFWYQYNMIISITIIANMIVSLNLLTYSKAHSINAVHRWMVYVVLRSMSCINGCCWVHHFPYMILVCFFAKFFYIW